MRTRTLLYYVTFLVSVLFETALLLINVVDIAFFHRPDQDSDCRCRNRRV